MLDGKTRKTTLNVNDSECCKINEENGEVDGRDWDEKGHEAGEDLTAVMVKEGQCQSGRLNSHAKARRMI